MDISGLKYGPKDGQMNGAHKSGRDKSTDEAVARLQAVVTKPTPTDGLGAGLFDCKDRGMQGNRSNVLLDLTWSIAQMIVPKARWNESWL